MIIIYRLIFPFIILSFLLADNAEAGSLCKDLNELASELDQLTIHQAENIETQESFLTRVFSSITSNFVGPEVLNLVSSPRSGAGRRLKGSNRNVFLVVCWRPLPVRACF